jgi:hypothetical protein
LRRAYEDPAVIAKRLTMKIYRMVRATTWLGSIGRSTINHQALPDTLGFEPASASANSQEAAAEFRR